MDSTVCAAQWMTQSTASSAHPRFVSKSPFRCTERNLVHPKGLYFHEQPTDYMKHWGKSREHLLSPKRLQRWVVPEKTPWTSWQGTSLGNYQWLTVPIASGCCVMSVLFCIWLHLCMNTWWCARSWNAWQHKLTTRPPQWEWGCDSAALPVHLGLRDKASAL